MVHLGEFLKTWSLRSNSVTRQVGFNGTKIGRKCQNWKIQMRHFEWFLNTVSQLSKYSQLHFCLRTCLVHFKVLFVGHLNPIFCVTLSSIETRFFKTFSFSKLSCFPQITWLKPVCEWQSLWSSLFSRLFQSCQ